MNRSPQLLQVAAPPLPCPTRLATGFEKFCYKAKAPGHHLKFLPNPIAQRESKEVVLGRTPSRLKTFTPVHPALTHIPSVTVFVNGSILLRGGEGAGPKGSRSNSQQTEMPSRFKSRNSADVPGLDPRLPAAFPLDADFRATRSSAECEHLTRQAPPSVSANTAMRSIQRSPASSPLQEAPSETNPFSRAVRTD